MSTEIRRGDYVSWRGKKYLVYATAADRVCLQLNVKGIFNSWGGPATGLRITVKVNE